MKINNAYKDKYIEWLKNNIYEKAISENVYLIELPFLNRNNDYLQILIKKENDKYIITDDGETVAELEMNGFDLFSSPKRKKLFSQILNSHGVEFNEERELFVISREADMPQKKHMLAQCMQKVDDLFYTTKQITKTLFTEDVKNYLDENDVRYIQDVQFAGKSGLSAVYDYAIGKSDNAPERIIKVINNLSNDSAKNAIFSWTDTVQRRPSGATLYAFIRDDEKLPEKAVTALREYEIKTIMWSERAQYVRELSA